MCQKLFLSLIALWIAVGSPYGCKRVDLSQDDNSDRSTGKTTESGTAYGSCLPDKGCVTGYIRHGLELVFAPGDNSLRPVEFHDAADFGDRFDSAFIRPLIEQKKDNDGLQYSDFEAAIEPSVTRDNFAKGFAIYVNGRMAYDRVVMNGEGNFYIGGIDPAEKNLSVKVVKELSLKLKNLKSGVTNFHCLAFESKIEGIEIPIAPPYTAYLGGVKSFTFRYVESLGPCKADTQSTQTSGPSSTTGPYAATSKIMTFDLAQHPDDDGENKMISASFDPESNKLWILKDVVRNRQNGSQHRRLYKLPLTEDGHPPVVDSSVIFTDWMPSHALPFQGKIYSAGDFDPWSIVSYNSDGQFVNRLVPRLDMSSSDGTNKNARLYLFKASDRSIQALALINNDGLRSNICDVSFITGDILTNCKVAPTSNPPSAAKVAPNGAKGIGHINGFFFLMAYSSETNLYSIHQFNRQFVYQKSYGINNLDTSIDALRNGFLASDGSGLLFIDLHDNQLDVRKLTLFE